MSANADALYHAALELPADAREELAWRILRSLDEHSDPGPTPDQEREIERRVEEVRQGTAEMIPAEDVFESILEGIRARKRT